MTKRKKSLILWFKEIGIKDVPLVGGKNAALGEMYRNLTRVGVNIPNGFAVTAEAYRHFMKKSGAGGKIEEILKGLNTGDIENLQKRGKEIRSLVIKSEMPADLVLEIKKAYKKLETLCKEKNVDVAVRSSATAEDLPGASFAGQQETYLNISGSDEVVRAVKKAIASLFTDRAISYRVDKGFSHTDVALSVGVQKMVRSDLAASGVAFSIDTETGFDKVVVINSAYGLGEMVVQGKVTPDEFTVFKPTLAEGYKAIIGQDLGPKEVKMVYAGNKTKIVDTTPAERAAWSLSRDEVVKLASWVVSVENYFSE